MLDETSMAALLDSFVQESEEGLQSAEEALLTLERDPDDSESLALAFRAMHTLKGNAGLFDFRAMVAVAHATEDLLDGIRSGRRTASSDVVSTLLDAVDLLRTLLLETDRTRPAAAREQELIARLEGGPSAGRSARASVTFRRTTHTLRIDVSRLDRLLDLTGEIGVARGRIGQLLESASFEKQTVIEAHRDAEQFHLELQELVMKLRMVPVGPSFRQLHRVVRDAARSAGKDAELRIDGGEVEVDMTIVDHLRDPLVHMIRNSISHGIETPEGRRAAGKPAVGRLRLRSFQDAGSIVIELSDDGAGIDRARVLERAVERGLIADGSTPSEKEILDLIFHPGLSTASDVTDLSGRGVGLDVVRRNIDAIHGSVAVTSLRGEGTTFRLRLPLTLAIVDGLLVDVAGEPFIIPMEAVVEAVRMPSVAGEPTATGVLTHRGESVPFLRLRQRLSGAGGSGTLENAVIVSYTHGRAALVIDELHGECQTVVKPLPRALRGIPGLSGSAILPNGVIAFIIDVPTLLQVEIDRRIPSPRTTESNQEKSCSAN